MRKGINPEKFKTELAISSYHRIVIPVYIPNLEGYFKDSLKILKLCIGSLLKSINFQTRITLYNNNSHTSVKDYLDDLYATESQIDQVFHSKENVGKINAILAATKGNLEPLITIADADVLFKQNWQEEVEKVFNNFKYAGMVSPVPSSKAYNNFTASNWFYGFFKGKLKFENVINPSEMKMFEDSLELNYTLYQKIHLEKYLTLQNNLGKAVMGCGHFVATLKREIFDLGSNSPALHKIVGGVENKFIDKPNEDLGFLRLSTLDNYAFHMGNTYESWMQNKYNLLQLNNSRSVYKNLDKIYKLRKINILIGKAISRILKRKKIKNLYFHTLEMKNKNY
ncbi:glycosyltransferase [uncultured Polaribacter sp.]|uniref:glycosyltransferase n=1 Tax=uncultured Polaribacter sp. TaxID=174711 RepID=UPI0026379D55|nr:glycosyltransferase [uncultured Polaribacter sp.]